MKRTQIYLSQEQHDFITNLSFVMSKKKHKNVSLSEIIRFAISRLMESCPENLEEETELILKSDHIMEGLEKALSQKPELSFKDIFGTDL